MNATQLLPETRPTRPKIHVERVFPQAGPQHAFLRTPADIAIAGGAAGGGKTWSLLVEPLRYLQKKKTDMGVVIFRRTYPQIKAEGGLWDEAETIYSRIGGRANLNDLSYNFKNGLRVRFAHMQHDKDRFQWKSTQMPIIEFDQVEDFTENQFWYMLTRNRHTPRDPVNESVKPYIRATCNPVPADDEVGGWLNRLVAWWINQETGLAISERSGVIRYFVREGDDLFWGDTREELLEKHPTVFESVPDGINPLDLIKSFTFIPSTLEDNPILDKGDPQYRGNLMALASFERDRLLGANWNARPTEGELMNRTDFGRIPSVPSDIKVWVRYWDKAGTKVTDADSAALKRSAKWTAGALIGVRPSGQVVIADMKRDRLSAHPRERLIGQTADADKRHYPRVITWIEQEPGSGGKESAEATVTKTLQGYEIHVDKVTGDKLTRAMPFISQVEAGNVVLVSGEWNEAFLKEAHAYNGVKGFMDQIDSAGGGYVKAVIHRPKEDALEGAAVW